MILFNFLANWVHSWPWSFTASSQLSCYTPPQYDEFDIVSSSSSGALAATGDAFHNKKLNHNNCTCQIPTANDAWTAQAGQDEYLFHRVFFQQALCCHGTFVEFGARNGIEHSNTYMLERHMDCGRAGSFEVDEREWDHIANQSTTCRNFTRSRVSLDPVEMAPLPCPRYPVGRERVISLGKS
jgi:hypothetical protein